MEENSYQYALFNRRNWYSPDDCGEVTYVGQYAVITGYREAPDEHVYGWIPGDTQYVTAMYLVGEGAIMDSVIEIIGKYDTNDQNEAMLNHGFMIDQASAMDLLEFSHGW